MDPIARASPERLRRLLPMLGVARVEAFRGESGLTGTALSVHRAVHRDGSFTAGVATDPRASWNRAAMRACTRLVRRAFRPSPFASQPDSGLLHDDAITGSDLAAVLRDLRRAGWHVTLSTVTTARRMNTVQCEARCPSLEQSRRGYGVAAVLESAALEALLETVAAVVEAVWAQAQSPDA